MSTGTAIVYRVIGLMSGTSADGVDAACIETDGHSHAVAIADHFRPYSEDERRVIRAAYAAAAALGPGDPWPDAVNLAAEVVTRAHVDAVQTMIAAQGFAVGAIHYVGFHGQTVRHDPARRFTLQIGHPQELARALGIDVVHDFRSADVAAGGQGAPLVPLYHAALAAGLSRPLAVLNLGGVGNVTYLGPDDHMLAFDTGPGNALIDDWVHQHTGASCDRDGNIAAGGQVAPTVLAQLCAHPFFALEPPKSLDRNAFSLDPVRGLSLADGAATLTAFTAASVAAAVRFLDPPPREWLVAGGGRHNPVLMAALEEVLGTIVRPIEALGLKGDSIEAEAFAYLAVRSRLGLPLSVPGTTGVPHPMTGGRLVRAQD